MKRIVNGLLVLDKPTGITSRDAVDRVLEWFPRRTKIGHTGTLDPLATGVLVICLGSATRLADYVQAMDKVYRTKIVLGASSDTDDADGTVTPTFSAKPQVAIDETSIREAIGGFIGVIAQTPPAYSAVKIDGKRAHDLARRGREVEIAPRPVQIYGITVLGYTWPELDLEIHCGKGTYIRSLARDLGEKLGSGAYVKELRRIRVGPFLAEQGATLDDTPSTVDAKLLPPRTAVAHLPVIEADANSIGQLTHGQPMATPLDCREIAGTEVAIIDDYGALVGVGCVNDKGETWPVKVLVK